MQVVARGLCGTSGRLCCCSRISFPSSLHCFKHLTQRGETPGQSGLTPWVSQARGLAHHGAGCLESEVGWIRHVCSEWYGYALGLGLLLWFRSWLMLCLLDGLFRFLRTLGFTHYIQRANVLGWGPSPYAEVPLVL